jgi:hypothetical protein
MKRCPQCRQTFSDDYLYCLADGTPLTYISDSPEETTVVRPSPPAQPPAQIVRQGVSPVFAYLAIGLLAFVVGGAFVLWLKSGTNLSPAAMNGSANTASNSAEPASNKEQDSLSRQKADLQGEQASIEREKQKLADERKTLEAQSKKPLEAPTPAPATEPTARITFHKGSVQEMIYGSVASERNYVLRTRSGQYLSASVSSTGGCVVFNNGSTSTTYTTSSGDSSLTLVNNCGARTSFSMTIYVE